MYGDNPLKSLNVNTKVYFKGIFKKLRFINDEGTYHVYSFSSDNIIIEMEGSSKEELPFKGDFVVTSAMSAIEKLTCRIEGIITEYKGEKQVKMHCVNYIQPETIDDIVSFLSSKIIKGIGPKIAEKVVNGYRDKKGNFFEGLGQQTLDIIKADYMVLARYPGISGPKALTIHESYMDNIMYQEVFQFFIKYGISENMIYKIYEDFGYSSIAIAQKNPYKFSKIDHIGFKTCDEIARKLGISSHSEERISSGVIYCLNLAKEQGHCYLPKSLLIKTAYEALKINLNLGKAKSILNEAKANKSDKVDIDIDGLIYNVSTSWLEKEIQILMQIREKKKQYFITVDTVSCKEIDESINYLLKVKVFQDVIIKNNGDPCIYMRGVYNTERSLVMEIKRLNEADSSVVDLKIINARISDFEQCKGFQLEQRQKEAVIEAFKTNFMILTGSAGSGKTTTVECLIHVLTSIRKDLKFIQVAPTGRAAKRMTEVTGFEAKTIHRLLEYMPKDGSYEYNSFNQLEDYSLIIIDETSLLDVNLAYDLFQAIADGTKVILIGDPKQLPSVGVGNVLLDMINSKMIKTVELNVIKRQLENSGIILNANKINNGQIPKTEAQMADFFVISCDCAETISNKLLLSFQRFLKLGHSIDDVQVISPQRKGPIGTFELNRKIQEIINPPSDSLPEIKCGDTVFRVNDRVLHLKNNYDAPRYEVKNGKYVDIGVGVFNGDFGKIINIFEESEEDKDAVTKIAVQYDSYIILYDKKSLDQIMHGFASTVHKMQGSQSDIIIAPISYSHYMMLSRNLLYTLVTRAKKKVVLVVEDKALQTMVSNDLSIKRYTMLQELLSGNSHFDELLKISG